MQRAGIQDIQAHGRKPRRNPFQNLLMTGGRFNKVCDNLFRERRKFPAIFMNFQKITGTMLAVLVLIGGLAGVKVQAALSPMNLRTNSGTAAGIERSICTRAVSPSRLTVTSQDSAPDLVHASSRTRFSVWTISRSPLGRIRLPCIGC